MQYCTSGPFFFLKKTLIRIPDVDDQLDVFPSKFSNKQIFVAPWTISVGLMEVCPNNYMKYSLTSFLMDSQNCYCFFVGQRTSKNKSTSALSLANEIK